MSLCVVLVSAAALTSCLNDDNDSEEGYSDTAVTAVTLGTLNRYTRGTSSSTGNDTVVKTTLTGSNYKLTIDHLGCRIYNADSLPVGTDLGHVTISAITTQNDGVPFIMSATDSSLMYYVRSTDSLDFSTPRVIRVMASNGVDYRDYTMTLSASSTTGTKFGWQRVAQRSDLAGWSGEHLAAHGDSVALTGILGATDHEMFAMGSDGRIKVCTDGSGTEWSDETLDDSEKLLPATGMAMTSWKYAPADSTDCILLAGNCDSIKGSAVCWRKLSRYHAAGMPTQGTWVYMPIDGYNRYTLPRQEYLSLAYYNNVVLAVGSDMVLYQSRDQGITWKTSSIYALPANVTGKKASIAADRKGRLWLLTDSGELWMGMLR